MSRECAFDTQLERKRIKGEIESFKFNIVWRLQEIDQFRDRLADLENRLTALDVMEENRRELGMMELIRLCNTPAWRFKPRIG